MDEEMFERGLEHYRNVILKRVDGMLWGHWIGAFGGTQNAVILATRALAGRDTEAIERACRYDAGDAEILRSLGISAALEEPKVP